MPKVYALSACFHFPVFDAWKLETYAFQWLKFGAMAVSGLLSNCRRKPKFSPHNLLKTLSFQFPDFPPYGEPGPETGPAPWAECPYITTEGADHDR